jgi:hypothetical protein
MTDVAAEHVAKLEMQVAALTGISTPEHLFRPSRLRTKQPGGRCAFISGASYQTFPN